MHENRSIEANTMNNTMIYNYMIMNTMCQGTPGNPLILSKVMAPAQFYASTLFSKVVACDVALKVKNKKVVA
jgi:hypothetical protein